MTDVAIDGLPLIEEERPSSLPLRHVAAVVVGNALEFYDFLIYSFFAVYIGRTFFPSHSAASSLLLSLATFGAGFLTRPIGAIVIGSMGDRIGRKPAMMWSFGLMGIAIVGLPLTPSYERIGVAAPIVVLAFRLLQGFALGGEVGPTTAYLIEAAPPGRRGIYTVLQNASQNVSLLLSGLIGTLLAYLLDAQQLQDWGWRVAMLIGAAIVPFGLLIRASLPETLHAADDAVLAPDATTGSLSRLARLRPYLALIIFGLMMLAAGTIGTYVGGYMTTYALTTLHMQAAAAFGVTLVKGITAMPVIVFGGWLSDRYGRKPVMIWPTLALVLSILPVFVLVLHHPSIAVFYAGMTWLGILGSLGSPSIIVALTESLPKSIRSGALATIYAFAIAIFGGSTQFTVTWLLDFTKDPLAPAYYWTGAALVGLLAMVLMRESAPVKLTRVG